MADKVSSLDDLSSEQITALVELAEAYQKRTSSRRDVLKAAAAGAGAGLLSSAGFSVATDSGQPAANGNQQVVQREGTAIATPGNVQAAIDAVASNDSGMVRLDPTQRYEQPSSPWTIKRNVVLDFNGAFLYGTGDLSETDIIHIHPGAQVYRPRINLYDGGSGYTPANSYQGRVFSLDTRLGRPYFADGTTIRGGNLIAAGNTGTACYIGVNTTGNESVITHIDLEFDIGTPKRSNAENSVDTALHLDTRGGGDDGWINGVYVGGHWRYPRTGVLQEGVTGKYNQQVLNQFNVQIQPGEDANAFWEIKDPTWARLNKWCGIIWDYTNYGDYAWKIDSQYQDSEDSFRGCKRNAVNTPNFDKEFVRNRSPNEHYINHTHRFESTVV